MHVDEVLKLAKKSKLDQIESAWTDLLGDDPGDLDPLFSVPEVLVERGHPDMAESLVWYLVDLLSERGHAARALRAAQRGGRTLPRSELLRGLLADLYVQVHADRADIDGLVQLTIRSPEMPLDEAMDGLANLMAVHPGSYVLDPQHGTVGRTEGLDPDRGGLVVTFEGGEKVYGIALVPRLKPADEEDFRALSAFERERLTAMAWDDPEELVRILLSTIDRRMELRRLKLYLEPVVGQWGKWWSTARKGLERSSIIGVTEGRSPSVFLRKRPVSLAERLLQRFRAATDIQAKLAAGLHLLRETQAHPDLDAAARQALVQEVAALGADAPAPLAAAASAVAEAFSAQWEDVSGPEGTSAPERALALLADPEGLAAALTEPDVLLCTLAFVRRHAPSGWAQMAASLMPVASREACGAIAQRLSAAGAEDELAEARREIMARPDRSAGALAWLWRDCTAGRQPEADGGPAPAVVAIQVLSSLAGIVRAGNLSEDDRKEQIAELRGSLFIRGGESLMDALKSARPEQVAAIKSLGERNPGLTERMQSDLVGMLREVRPALFARVVLPWEESVVYTTQSGIERRQEELEQIVHVRLPEVAREIGQAAGFGDISDNAEYRSAVAERARLAERAGRIQEELAEARLITHELATAEHVTIGSRVVARNLGTGQPDTFTFLGPWDAVPEQGIIAYNAPLGLAFMGKTVGDEVELRIGPDERRWEVVQIEPSL
jgi:transcription elongation GreA/GreB family factor